MSERKEYWMSYSSYKKYKECPKKYWYAKVGQVEPAVQDSGHFAIVGSVVQQAYEDFYNQELWRRGSQASGILHDKVTEYFYQFLDNRYVDFGHVTCNFTMEEALQDCYDLIPVVLQGIKDHKLLGPYAQSEVKLRGHLAKNFFMFGRVDFLIRTAEGEVILLDGKASKHREKYVDEEQLQYYALAFHQVHGRLPDKVGFFYFRYADQGDKAIDWIDIDPDTLAQLKTKVMDTFIGIQRRAFKATPSGSACKYCLWESMCEERQAQKEKKRLKRRWQAIEDGKEVLPEMDSSNPTMSIGFGGFVEGSDTNSED